MYRWLSPKILTLGNTQINLVFLSLNRIFASIKDELMLGIGNKKDVRRLLVMRFSAMGDVAMTVPVLHCLASQHPDVHVTVVTRKRMTPMFGWLPGNVEVMGIDLDDYKGITGLTSLYKILREKNFDAVADLHDVLRTKYIRTCFRMAGVRVAIVDKGRKDKKRLIGNAQKSAPMKPMIERYATVFDQLGLPVDLSKLPVIDMSGEDFSRIKSFAGQKTEGERWVGVAPFAAHAMKMYPLDNMRMVVNLLLERGYRVFLFGAGKEESEELASWECDDVKSVCGKLGGLRNEMILMSQLDLMISMDSANMHIASLLGTKVLSVWGATHPKAGFTGYGQSPDSIVQIDLPCRPCSIYGNKPCVHGDQRCMDIQPETIVNKAVDMVEQ